MIEIVKILVFDRWGHGKILVSGPITKVRQVLADGESMWYFFYVGDKEQGVIWIDEAFYRNLNYDSEIIVEYE
jgi:hypothetical protein